MKSICVVFFCSLFLNTLQGQRNFQFVDSVKVFPKNPTITDSVTIITYDVITTVGPKNHQSFEINDTSIYLYCCYILSNLAQTVHTQDTFNLGLLPINDYTVRYHLGLPYYDEVDSTFDCLSYYYYDSVFVHFSVSSTNNTDEILSNLTLLTSNPASNSLTITTEQPCSNTTLQLLSIEGKQLLMVPLKQTTQIIDISMLPTGLYFAVLQNGKGRVVKKFVKE